MIQITRYVTTKNIILHEFFFYKFVKKNFKKRFFSAIFFKFIFLKNLNWQINLSWVIIFYKIIKFVSISFKICCEKYFIQNILQKN